MQNEIAPRNPSQTYPAKKIKVMNTNGCVYEDNRNRKEPDEKKKPHLSLNPSNGHFVESEQL